jgi:hypothetical protein
MKTRTIVLIVAAILLPIIVVIGGAVWLIYAFITGPFGPPPTPAELKKPRVVVGEKLIVKTALLEQSFWGEITGKDRIGRINDVSVAEWDNTPGLDIVIAGNRGALQLDSKGTRLKEVLFQFTNKPNSFEDEDQYLILGSTQVVDVERDGKCEYLARGSVDGAALFSTEGKLVWSSEERKDDQGFLSNATVGDLDNDGSAEIVVSWDGIQVFDKTGKKLSELDEEYDDTQLEVVDTDGDGKNEIISLDGSLKVRNSKGEVIKEIDVEGYFGNYSLLEMPDRTQPLLLAIYRGQLLLIDLNGEVVSRFDAPMSEFDDPVRTYDGDEIRGTRAYEAEGVWVKLANEQPKYLAVISNFGGIDRSVLDVFNPEGKLLYQELFPDTCSSVAALPESDGQRAESLLVACEATVLKFAMR